MEGIKHLIVMLAGIIGLLIGGVIIDLDHKGTWDCKFKKFFNSDSECYSDSGIFHDRTVMFTLIVFNLCFAGSYLFHFFMDMK